MAPTRRPGPGSADGSVPRGTLSAPGQDAVPTSVKQPATKTTGGSDSVTTLNVQNVPGPAPQAGERELNVAGGVNPEAAAQGFPPGLVYNVGGGQSAGDSRRQALAKLNNRSLAELSDEELKELAPGFGVAVTPAEHGQPLQRSDYIRALEAAGASGVTVDPRGIEENRAREEKAAEDQAERERETQAVEERRRRAERGGQEEGKEEGHVHDPNDRR